MSSGLPECLDIPRAADQGRALQGRLSNAGMDRLASLLAPGQWDVGIDLVIDRDEQGIARIRGRIRATLALVCQRCLKPFQFPLEKDVLLGAVDGYAQAAQLPEAYEPLVTDGDLVSLSRLVEDELLLALPQIPAHPFGSCQLPTLPNCGVEEEAAAGSGGPFAVLASLKGDPD